TECWPSETTAATGTPTARVARSISPARSSWVADSRLWASRTRPLRQSRSTHSTSWPTSGCKPSSARMTRPWARRDSARRRGLVAAVQRVGDGTGGQDDAARRQGLVDLRHGAVLGVAEGADVGHDVQAELVVGQGQSSLGLGPEGGEVAAAAAAVAAADEQV